MEGPETIMLPVDEMQISNISLADIAWARGSIIPFMSDGWRTLLHSRISRVLGGGGILG
jgi:hypothetical protein